MLSQIDTLYHLSDEERAAIRRYKVSEGKDIFRILNKLQQSMEVGKIYYTTQHYSLTSIIRIDLKSGLMVLDNNQAFLLNKPVHHEPYLIYKTKQDGLNIQFVAEVVGQRRHADGPGLLVKIPNEIIRLQRREFPRFSTIGKGIRCQIITNKNHRHRVVVADLSQHGLGLVQANSQNPDDTKQENIIGCTIELPKLGEIELPLTLKNRSNQSLKDGQPVIRYGFSFKELSETQQPLIKQYLQQNYSALSAH